MDRLKDLDVKIEEHKKLIAEGAKGISSIEKLDDYAKKLKKQVVDLIKLVKERRRLVRSEYAEKHIDSFLGLGNEAKVKLSKAEYDALLARIEVDAPPPKAKPKPEPKPEAKPEPKPEPEGEL